MTTLQIDSAGDYTIVAEIHVFGHTLCSREKTIVRCCVAGSQVHSETYVFQQEHRGHTDRVRHREFFKPGEIELALEVDPIIGRRSKA